MTLNNLIPEVRALINDSSMSGVRWDDLKIIDFLTQSIVLLGMMRPESKYINGKLVDIDFGFDKSLFIIPNELMRWKDGFVYFAAGKCLEEDSTDTANMQLAADFIGKATSRFQL